MDNLLNAVKVLAIDQIANAKSGHPGMAISASKIAYTLYKNVLNVVPDEPMFINRDRVVFSAGHCSALVYSILHLCGFNISIEDLKNFRKFGSKTCGHPEFGVCDGVDASTGPLGQGIAMAVGMAIAERHLAERFNKENYPIIDHYTYAICGEGCLMEGVSYEACSLAGLHKLSKLIIIYDCNKVTIDGESDIAFNEDLQMRFKAQGFNCFQVASGASVHELTSVIEQAKKGDKPSFIIVPSIIGEGTKVAGTSKAHGTPLTVDEAIEFRKSLGFSSELFDIPSDVRLGFENVKENGAKLFNDYMEMLSEYKQKYPLEYTEFEKCFENNYDCMVVAETNEALSGRDLGHLALNCLGENVKNLIGGTADLMSSTKAFLEDGGDFSSENYKGKNIHFGVREFSMGAICSGIALHGGLVPYCSTFLSFSDYMKPAIRLSALMKLKVLYIFTHDSIEVGEDGPTHQPVEQLDMLRSIPNLQVLRPCSKDEVAFAYSNAMMYNGPSAIVLSKNKLPQLKSNQADMLKGLYIISKVDGASANIVATGLEVDLAIKVQKELESDGVFVNVASLINGKAFENLSDAERENICGDLPVVILETSTALSVQKLFDGECLVLNMSTFGASGSRADLYDNFGFSIDAIKNKIKAFLCGKNA